MKLTIQIVNFRSREHLSGCLLSISSSLPPGIDTEILLINNDEKPLDADFSAQLLENGKNVGFGKAHNIGAARAQGDFILFLNPDAQIRPRAIETMVQALDADEKLGVVGPVMVDSSDREQPDCYGKKKTLFSIIGGKLFSAIGQPIPAEAGGFEVDWVSGGALMARRDVFEKVHGFDEDYFMYFEDVDFCLRVKELGYKVAVIPQARIFHEGGKSFESQREKKKFYYASQDHYLRKNFGPLAAGVAKLIRLPYYIKNVYWNH